jgi:hypothetical protein
MSPWLIIPAAAALYTTFWWALGRLARHLKPRRPGSLNDIINAPGPVIHPCGCMPCPQHAAAQAARAKAHMARDAWAAEMNERFHDQ